MKIIPINGLCAYSYALNKIERSLQMPDGVELVKVKNPKSMWAARQGSWLQAIRDGKVIHEVRAGDMTSKILRQSFVRAVEIKASKV